MKFKIDENLPVEFAKLLADFGHDADTVHDERLVGAPDSVVIVTCKTERRCLVTLDLDFSDMRAYPPSDLHGLIIFRLRYGSVGIRQVARSAAKFVIASGLMGVLTYAFIRIPGLYQGSWAQKATALTVAILLAVASYLGAARLLRARELQEMGGVFGHHSA